MNPGTGHNRGPESTGLAWRTHCWTVARARLLPTLPIEVVRLRVRRAQELGLEYKTYAGIRASTGHDLTAFLFSSNALCAFGPLPQVPPAIVAKLAAITGAARIGLAIAPLTPETLVHAAPLDAASPAPAHLGSFALARDQIRLALGRLPADTVLLVGAHELEADWCAAARLGGYLCAARYFTR